MTRPIGLAVAVLLLAAGCGPPKLRLEWSRPARVQIPANARVFLDIHTDGVPPAGIVVVGVALDALRGQTLNKWLAVEPVRHSFGRSFASAGRTLVPANSAEFVIRVRPTDWAYQALDRGAEGKSGSGKLHVRVEALRADGGAALYENSYWATGELPLGAGPAVKTELDVMLQAADRLSARVQQDFRPVRVSRQVKLDDSDPACATGIALCRKNQFDAAHEAFQDAVKLAPSSAPLLYDLAVMKEIRGDYGEAEELIGRATKIAPKPIYYEALERIRGARRDAEAFEKK